MEKSMQKSKSQAEKISKPQSDAYAAKFEEVKKLISQELQKPEVISVFYRLRDR